MVNISLKNLSKNYPLYKFLISKDTMNKPLPSFCLDYRKHKSIPDRVVGIKRAKKAWEIFEDNEKNKYRVILIDSIEKEIFRSKSSLSKPCKCKAKTLSGRLCLFNAVGGDFCKRHSK